MAIQKPSKPASAADFIAVAPDGLPKDAKVKAAPKLVMKGDKAQITVTFDLATLEDMNRIAPELGVSRAGLINMAVKYFIKNKIDEIR